MQIPLFKKTILTHPCLGASEVAQIFKFLNARLVEVDTVEAARKRKCDGILLLGGQDVNPFWYGEANLYSKPFDRDRDIVEWTLARRALSEHKPVMGICRGHQMLAVASGGSLYQDIRRQRVSKRHQPYHSIVAREPLRSRLPELRVNSRHHQAVKTVPYGFRVVATSLDGVIEAIWRPGALGVQWHPEDLFFTNHHWYGLFEWFVTGGLM